MGTDDVIFPETAADMGGGNGNGEEGGDGSARNVEEEGEVGSFRGKAAADTATPPRKRKPRKITAQDVVAKIRKLTKRCRNTDARRITASAHKRGDGVSLGCARTQSHAVDLGIDGAGRIREAVSEQIHTSEDHVGTSLRLDDLDWVTPSPAVPLGSSAPAEEPALKDRHSSSAPRAQEASTSAPPPVVDDPPPPPVLLSFDAHVAHRIQQTPPIGNPPTNEYTRRTRCYTRPHDFARLRRYYPEDPAEGSWFWIAEQTGLTRNKDLQYGYVDHNLMGAFIERWHPETNSFHFPWGEITITLHDVALILGLAIEGFAVSTGPFSNVMEERAYCNELFGYMFGVDANYVSPLDTYNMTKSLKKGKVMSAAFFSHVLKMIEEDADPGCIAAGYLWYAMSSSLFLDKTTNELQTRLLPLFDDPTRIVDTAWATGVLALLYRNLGEASRREVVGLAGCPYLLQMWIWMYFIYFPTNPNHEHRARGEADERRAAQYHTDRTATQQSDRRAQYRRILDEYLPEDVRWMPYGNLDFVGRYRASTYRGTIRFLDIVEPYMPDRVVRQFGRQQSRPLDPIPPIQVSRPRNFRGKNKYTLKFPPEWDRWERMEENLCPYILTSPPASPAWDVDAAYLDWYLQISHPYVSRFSERQKRLAPPIPAPVTVDLNRRLALMTMFIETQLAKSSGEQAAVWREMLELATSDDPPNASSFARASQMDPSMPSIPSPSISSIIERGESSRMVEERAAAEARDMEENPETDGAVDNGDVG